MSEQDNLPPTWREFEYFRTEVLNSFTDLKDEVRRSKHDLEQKLWGLVGAVFLLVIGYIFGQVTQDPSPIVDGAKSGAAAIVLMVYKHFGG